VTIPFHRNVMDAMADWDPEREALFYVIDKEAGGIVAKYKVCFPSIVCRWPADLYPAIRPTLTFASTPSMLTMRGMTSL